MDLRREYENKRIVVTGAAGFVASHLVDALVALGARVIGIDDFSDGRRENLTGSRSAIELIAHDVTVAAGLDDFLAGADTVFHLAANASVPRSAEQPELDFASNVIGTFRVMEAARRRRVGRVVFTSSAAVYGDPVHEPMGETHPYHPKSPYGGSKLAGEYLLDSFARCFDFDHRRVRLFNTYGPRQRKYVMFDLLEKLRRDPKKLMMLGTGEQVREYSFVSDTVDAILLVGAHEGARGHVFNVSGDRAIDVKALVTLVVDALGIPKPEISYSGQSWPGDVQRWLGDSSKLRGLGFVSRVSLEQGIRALIDWHRATFHPAW